MCVCLFGLEKYTADFKRLTLLESHYAFTPTQHQTCDLLAAHLFLTPAKHHVTATFISVPCPPPLSKSISPLLDAAKTEDCIQDEAACCSCCATHVNCCYVSSPQASVAIPLLAAAKTVDCVRDEVPRRLLQLLYRAFANRRSLLLLELAIQVCALHFKLFPTIANHSLLPELFLF